MTSLARTLAVAAACCSFAAPAASDENWARFRGPNGSGVAEGAEFPVEWTDDDYLWKVALPGSGHSSPIGWGDQIYATAGDSQAGVMSLVALDAATGSTRWTLQFDSPAYQMHAMNALASSTPAADAERVYVAWASPDSLQVAAVEHGGKEAWRRDLGAVGFKHGFGASPIVVDDLVIMPCDHTGDSFVVALDAKTGDVRWRTPRAPGIESYATAAVIPGEDGAAQVIVNSSAEGMAALAVADGALKWQLPHAFVARCVGSPVVAEGLVIGTSGEGGNGRNLTVVRPPRSGGEAEVAYQLPRSLPQVPTPVAYDGMLFVWSDRGVATCCDLHTGNVHWTERIGGQYAGSPVVAGGKVYCVSTSGEAVVLAASEKFAALGRSELGEGSEATPAVHGGRLYFRTEKSLACLAPRSP